jgi:hypothetical protein|tara:strand:- start:764 stop:1048 length:285 start_codon:yes stop_codon:yes gene_type:complete
MTNIILEDAPDIYNEFDCRSEIEIPLHYTQEANVTEAGAEDVLTISTPKGGYVHACLTIIAHIADQVDMKCTGYQDNRIKKIQATVEKMIKHES